MRRAYITLGLVAVLSLGIFSVSLPSTFAQTYMGDTVTLQPNRPYPKPFSIVSIELAAYTVNMVGAEVFWYIDGTEQPTLRGQRTIEVEMKDVGEATTIRATITRPQGGSLSANTTLIPSNTDIIIEADTYIPTFYKGRALPSMSSVVRAIAITQAGKRSDRAGYSYDWRYNNIPMFGGPVSGKQSITLNMPRYDNEILSVTVYDNEGRVVSEQAILLEAAEPELHFYGENALRGIGRKALGDEYILVGDEVLVHAEPYYLNSNLSPRSGTFDWYVNEEPVASGSTDPHIITLRRSEQTGTAGVRFSVETFNKYAQRVEGFFNIFTK